MLQEQTKEEVFELRRGKRRGRGEGTEKKKGKSERPITACITLIQGQRQAHRVEKEA